MTLVLLDKSDAVATLTLNRAGMSNALVPELLEALLARIGELRGDDAIRAVLLRANGEAFSLGGDMRRFRREYDYDIVSYAAGLVGKLNEAILAFIDLPQPVVAAVHGVVSGGAMGFVLASDIVLAAHQVAFKAHYATAGFSPDGGWATLFARLAGARRASGCLLLNRAFSAEQALEWGLVNQVVAPDRLHDEALAAARKIARYPEGSMRLSKRLLWRERDDIAAALEAERRGFLALIGIAAAREGVETFLRNFADYPDEG